MSLGLKTMTMYKGGTDQLSQIFFACRRDFGDQSLQRNLRLIGRRTSSRFVGDFGGEDRRSALFADML